MEKATCRRMAFRAALAGAAVVLLALSLCGCGKSATMAADADLGLFSVTDAAMTAQVDDEDADGTAAAQAAVQPSGEEPYAGEKITYAASATVQTSDYPAAREALRELADSVGAIVQSEEESLPGEGSRAGRAARGVFALRVPAEAFEGFMESLADVGAVTQRSVSAQNVTRAYSEAESRIRSLEIQRDRLEEMLEKAENVDDMLTIEGQLQGVRSQLESEKNNKARMEADVAYSTATITLVDVSQAPGSDEGSGFGDRLAHAASGAWAGFASLAGGAVLALVGAWPFVVLLAAIAAIAVGVRRGRGRKGPRASEGKKAGLRGRLRGRGAGKPEGDGGGSDPAFAGPDEEDAPAADGEADALPAGQGDELGKGC